VEIVELYLLIKVDSLLGMVKVIVEWMVGDVLIYLVWLLGFVVY